MKLETSYLGLKLKSPLVPSASPLTMKLDSLRKMEDHGAAAVVLGSLFEEQLTADRQELTTHLEQNTNAFAEAQSFFPNVEEYRLGPEEYLGLIQSAHHALEIPVIASLNGTTQGNWIHFAKQIEDAGARALELNIYNIPTDFNLSPAQIEETYIQILKSVKNAVKIPVALKLSPYFTNMAYAAKKFDEAGADALVLFNRFYQPDIDLETLMVSHGVNLSSPQARRLPMRWIAILFGRIKAELAATSGIHYAEDVVRMVMAGASVTMLCSALMRYGIEHLSSIEKHLREWMEKHEYDSIEQMRGSMSQIRCENPSAYERAQYIKVLQGYRPFL